MINNIGTVRIDQGIEYISDWKDSSGNFMIESILDNSRMIINKVVTGCGFTTYCLINNENTIIVSPRVWLIREKSRKFSNSFYFNRELNSKKSPIYTQDQILSSLSDYLKNWNGPKKILVTYDSFSTLVDLMESQLGVDVFDDYRIVIDESQSIIKDVILKEYNNKSILTNFLKRLFHYEKLLFISATPLVDYLSEIPEFKLYPVKYVELDWSNVMKVEQRLFNCKSSLDAFDDIYTTYTSQSDPNGRHVFDIVYQGDNQAEYSYEAVIFLNSVSDICRIVNKYVVKNGLIDINDVTVVCARTGENEKKLRKIHSQLTIAPRLPNEGEHHTTWTFVTRTAFEGVDFYSPSASTYVIANYNVEALQLDIASDIPQIVGRQRLKSNIFRNIINIYCKNSKYIPSEEEFIRHRVDKIERSTDQIGIYNSRSNEKRKKDHLDVIAAAIEGRPELLYLETTSGVPRISTLLLVSEKYTYDILKNQIGMYVIPGKPSSSSYSPAVIELAEKMKELDGKDVTRHRIKLVYLWLTSGGVIDKREVLRMLYNEGYRNIVYYFNRLSLDRIRANNYQPWEIEKEIKFSDSKGNISDFVAAVFKKGECYKKSDVKWMLQEIYDKLGILKTAKATELPTYISVRNTIRNGEKVYKIL